MLKMRDPIEGIEFKERKKVFGSIPLCTTGKIIHRFIIKFVLGIDILKWTMKHLKADQDEALLYIKLLMAYGFIVPIDPRQNIYMSDETLYTYQVNSQIC